MPGKAATKREITVPYEEVSDYLLKGWVIISFGSDGVLMASAKR